MDSESIFNQMYRAERAARVAVLYEHTEITYEDLRDRTIRAAEAQNALCINAGDRVAILLSDSPEFIASFVAVISLAAIAVPINLALRREDQLFILKDCGACAAIIEPRAAESLFQTSDVPADLKDMLVVRRDDDSNSDPVAGMKMQSFESAERRQLGGEFPVRGNEDMNAFILYTSGS